MKKIVFLVTTAAVLLVSCEQNVKEKEVPVAVKNALLQQYPQIKSIEWVKEGANYEAEFEMSKLELAVVLDASGKILEAETEMDVAALPESINAYVSQHYAGKKIKEAAKIVDARSVITYEAEVGSKDLIFDATGNFLKEVKD